MRRNRVLPSLEPSVPPRCHAFAGVMELYEQKLKAMYPTRKKITYSIEDMFEFIDSLADLVCLV